MTLLFGKCKHTFAHNRLLTRINNLDLHVPTTYFPLDQTNTTSVCFDAVS